MNYDLQYLKMHNQNLRWSWKLLHLIEMQIKNVRKGFIKEFFMDTKRNTINLVEKEEDYYEEKKS